MMGTSNLKQDFQGGDGLYCNAPRLGIGSRGTLGARNEKV
jgi:hypothetical protein